MIRGQTQLKKRLRIKSGEIKEHECQTCCAGLTTTPVHGYMSHICAISVKVISGSSEEVKESRFWGEVMTFSGINLIKCTIFLP